MVPRPSKDEYYLNIAREVRKRSNCFRLKNGVIIVNGDQIVATGYNGAPRGTKDCLERGACLRDMLKIEHGTMYEKCRSVHAEQNAIINAARAGVRILGGTLYMSAENENGDGVDSFPCYVCKKMIINAGLERLVCSTKTGESREFLVSEWVSEWKIGDILDDKYQYGKDQNEIKPV